MIRNRIYSVWGGVIRVMVRLDLSPRRPGYVWILRPRSVYVMGMVPML